MVKSEVKIISDIFIQNICERLAANKPVRRSLPVWGRVHIDRQLPFLCVYRRLHEDDNSLSERLITGEASYLTATGDSSQHKQLSLLVKSIAVTLNESFGSFLIVEIWSAGADDDISNYGPSFTIIQSKKPGISSTIETLERALNKIKIRREPALVNIVSATKIAPPGRTPLLPLSEIKQIGCHIIGIKFRPIHQHPVTNQMFPLVRRELQRGFGRALKTCFFNFTHDHTPYRPQHYHSLGRWSVVKSVWEVDRQLAAISDQFDFLLQVTPTNNAEAWSAFQRNRFENIPKFTYRPLPVDPLLAKRQLFKVPIERIEDPTLAQLFRDQQIEMDRKLTMLIDRDTPRFKYGSLQIYGAVDDSLMNLACELLEQLPPRSRDESQSNSVDAQTFAARASLELDSFKQIIPQAGCRISVRKDISGLMVSQGNLLIGAGLKIPASRIEALIQHEVGTHVLTYLNGKAQPFQQLYIGLAGYEELQEGLAVLSEYFAGGLTRPRMRLLAARVVSARQLIGGASFVDVFRTLNKEFGFERRTVFNITTRTFRCGGLTKDAVYLRGLVKLLKYLREGGLLEPLFVGKISADHLGVIRELQWRKVLNPAPLRPRYLDEPQAILKMNDLKKGLTPVQLIKRSN